MPGLRSDLAKGKADTVGMCDCEKVEDEWFSCWKERQVCVQSQAMSISALFTSGMPSTSANYSTILNLSARAASDPITSFSQG